MYDRIFVAIDDDVERGKPIIRKAMELAETNKARLEIGHAIDSTALETAGVYPDDFVKKSDTDFRNGIADLVSEAKSSDGIAGVDVVVKYGRIRETLLDDMIEPYDPDLVICGARGLSPFRYALLGSVSTFLVRAVHCDVLVVKANDEQEAAASK